MGSSLNPRSGSSERSKGRKRAVIAAGDSTRDRYSSLERSIVGARGSRPGSGRRPVPGTLRSAGRRVAGNKAEERDSRIRAQRRRVQLRIGLLVLAVLAAIAGVVWLFRSSVFIVESVEIVGGKRLSTAQITELAALPRDVTLLRLPTKQIESRLERNPWISSAEVTRDFPDTVRIRVAERTPAALVGVNSKSRWLVDRAGVWLAAQSTSATSTLILVRDVDGLDPVAGKRTQSETLLNALAVLSRLDKGLAPRIRAVSAPSIDKTALVTRDGVEVFVGTADDIVRKQQVAAKILQEQAGNVVYINVRTVDSPTWRGLEGKP